MSESNPNRKAHIFQVDYIRAIASVAVVLFHLGGKTLPILKYGWLGVYMFFLLSGFIICHAMPLNYSFKDARQFIVKRIIRIEPPYIISMCIAIVVNYILVANYKINLLNILSHIAYLNSFVGQPPLSPVYWTLGIEFQFYLFITICFPILLKQWGAVILVPLCILSLIIHLPGYSLISYFPIFGMGTIVFLYENTNYRKYNIFLGIVVLLISAFSVGLPQTIAGLITIVILKLPLKRNKIISFFSKISFSLYLTHDMIGSNYVVYVGALLPKTFLFRGLEFMTGIILSILLAYIFYILVEAPFLKASKKLIYPEESNR